MKSTAIGIASKQMTPDEARAKRDEPPLTDAQKKDLELVPLTISPTGMPKALPIAAKEQDPLLDPGATPQKNSLDLAELVASPSLAQRITAVNGTPNGVPG